ncbi:probable inactive poly [ADP-ribose] polymerase SRO5 [Lactuca sativa]|uniref:Poly [ADP-ribose] polymerase n=1 Tax=Lactuca sativa TaxID=4236 RepID=A0A9R1VT91_LACSA|nr:probable inactive poly [ADP-ribose] polymerase SRO5 [Lactuca sativa]KAJ0210161.1 hypothetical protein LSAT_V11C400187310 [Lactuca sativa]
MLQLLPAAMDPRLVGDDEGTSSSFGGDDEIRRPITEDSVSGGSSEDEDDSSSISDCESVISGSRIVEHTRIQPEGLVRLDESEKMYGIIEKKFISRLDVHGVKAQIQNIHRNLFNTSAITQARLRSFQIFSKAVEIKNEGVANIKYAWFGASKDEIHNIILHGFGHENIQKNGSFSHGVVLSPDHSPLESVESAIVDEDGVKHLLLCRVILGKLELVNPSSTQCHPSSENFQSGVDDLVSPKKFIVWSNQMNTHILPEFVVSFKTPSKPSNVNRSQSDGVRIQKPVSPWIPIPELIAALSKILPPKSMKEITQYRRSYIEHKISRRDMIQGIRECTGDSLLLMVLKDFTEQRKHGLN